MVAGFLVEGLGPRADFEELNFQRRYRLTTLGTKNSF